MSTLTHHPTRSKRSILQYVLALRDLNVLMDHIHFIIEQILAERRVSSTGALRYLPGRT